MNRALKSFLTLFAAGAALWSWHCAGAEQTGESALAALRRENRELRTQLLRQNEELARMKLWLAGMVSGEAELDRQQYRQLLSRFDSMIRTGKTLVLKSSDVSREFRTLLNKLQLDEAGRIRYMMMLDELDSAAAAFTGNALKKNLKDGDFRIIALDRKLQIVMISGGLKDGIAPGMIFRPAANPESKCRMRVISVRPEVCAADFIDGDWQDLSAGTAVTPFSRKR